MQDYEYVLNAIHSVTGISAAKILSPSRKWPVVEARMLFVLFTSRRGMRDEKIGFIINRHRTTVHFIRHRGEDYIDISKAFSDKYFNVKEIYDREKQIRLSQN